MVELFITLLFTVILSFIQWLRYKDKEKVDKGFVLNYYRLSDRRKLLRNIYMLPVIVAMCYPIFFMQNLYPDYLQVVLIAVLFFDVYQIVYLYFKWKTKEVTGV